MKYIDSEKLLAKIARRIQQQDITLRERSILLDLETYIEACQQEQPIKVYRVENEKEQKGLWRKFDGTWEPLFDMLTDGQCKNMPMEDSPIYREGGKQWFASAPSKETLQKWFSKRDLEELTAKGFTISEFEVVSHKKISDFEYIFTRDNIISRTYLKVSDIYPQEQPETDGDDGKFVKILVRKEFAEQFQRLGDEIQAGQSLFIRAMNQQEQLEVDLDKEIDACWQNWISPSNQKEVEGVLPKTEFAMYARHFWDKGYNARKEK